MERFEGRLGIQQRVLPAYRAAFFDALAKACRGGLSVFAGQPLAEENIATTSQLQVARYVPARNLNFFPIRSPVYQCWQANLVSWLEEWQPDVLILEANSRYASNRLAIRWMHAHRRPVIGWGLGEPRVGGILAGWRRRNRLALLKSLDGLIAYSQRGAEEYRGLDFPAGRVFVAPNAASSRPEAPPVKRAPGFTGRPQVLFVGRLQARKRIDNLLLACAALPADLQPHLSIVGDGPARGQFQSVAEKHYPRAEFLGARHGPDLEACFNTADLFVLPGTGGLAVQEAMAHGLPVIVAEGDGTQEDLVREEDGPRPANGWRVPPADLAALTGALREALSDPARLRRMGEASFHIVVEEVNLETMVAAFTQAAVKVAEAGPIHVTPDTPIHLHGKS